MRQILTIALIAIANLPIAAAALGEQKPALLGYLNPTTGKFTPKSSTNPSAAEVSVSGTIELKLSASIGSYIASSVPITCTADISPSDDSFQEDVSVLEFPATRSGNKATCDIALPYKWLVSSASEQLNLNYSIQTSSASLSAVNHTFSKYGETFPLPKNGAVTTISPAPPL